MSHPYPLVVVCSVHVAVRTTFRHQMTPNPEVKGLRTVLVEVKKHGQPSAGTEHEGKEVSARERASRVLSGGVAEDWSPGGPSRSAASSQWPLLPAPRRARLGI
ncbi:hypothetical protein PsYK624_013350 [Phanerochaete sordida]|uniref:Uncharacterized protein n=1 Tax=Phanerochaete sordida TaxID=48140 RepID=A0A9P3L7N5_9APHY|nr:hypothetical protein PsYK624_013350 [Phanerochaete sordida]